MCQPSDSLVQKMLGSVIPKDVTVKSVQPVSSGRPLRNYEVSLSTGKTVLLTLPPVSLWRPLRAEQDMLSSEAITVKWIRDTLAQGTSSVDDTVPSSSKPSLADSLLPLLPTLLSHVQDMHPPSSSFAVYETIQGTSLPFLTTKPTPADHHNIDRQLGRLVRDLAMLTSPTGRFGPVTAVLGTTNITTTQNPTLQTPTTTFLPAILTESNLATTSGALTWSTAFHSMLEGILRDGEDMAVAISYVSIRRHFRRLGWVLDGVTKGRLVVVEVEGDGRGNLVVREEGNEGEKGGEEMGDKESEDEADKKKAKKDDGEVGTEGDNNQPPTTTQDQYQDQDQQHQRLKLASLRDWSSAIFGDPLLATVFSDPNQRPPSAAFLAGFNDDTTASTPAINPEQTTTTTETTGTTETTTPQMPYPLSLPESIIESPTTAPVRLLFYQVYHAVTRIVAEFYRPQRPSESRTHELEARKKLNEVLARLAEKGQGSRHHHRRPSGEMSPAKKVKRSGELG
ncbi:uncharacterized protein C8A04DRAFT_15240 [Dichotomopilus funicola]|uniref:Uncharacterized protein n=1 Tax=Dichotomopilus funicola TaxID=1934379 RepID=A0AAN6ZJG5_9PEZI|nr:hypothetical protein C8A04DRAFT_15240 [Dichotomopilus funicola]